MGQETTLGQAIEKREILSPSSGAAEEFETFELSTNQVDKAAIRMRMRKMLCRVVMRTLGFNILARKTASTLLAGGNFK